MPDVAVSERTLPHNLEAEKSVLGAILIHNEAFNYAAEVITSRDFYRDAHRRIFEKMERLSEHADAIDLVTLKEELTRAGEIDEVGGLAYLTSLVDGVPRSTNVEHYARIVKEKSALRALILASQRISARAYEAEDDPNVILDEAEQAIFAIAENRARVGFLSMQRDRRREHAEDRAAVRAEAARHGRPDRLLRSGPHDARLPGRRPHHHRGAARRWARPAW